MCLLGLAIASHPDILFCIVHNRDENLSRPTRDPLINDMVWGGLDLVAGGYWMGINHRTGSFAALTNVRSRFHQVPRTLHSRGNLIKRFLYDPPRLPTPSPESKTRGPPTLRLPYEYSPFNMVRCNLFADNISATFISNHPQPALKRSLSEAGGRVHNDPRCIPLVLPSLCRVYRLPDGVTTYSNSSCNDSSWPKVNALRRVLLTIFSELPVMGTRDNDSTTRTETNVQQSDTDTTTTAQSGPSADIATTAQSSPSPDRQTHQKQTPNPRAEQKREPQRTSNMSPKSCEGARWHRMFHSALPRAPKTGNSGESPTHVPPPSPTQRRVWGGDESSLVDHLVRKLGCVMTHQCVFPERMLPDTHFSTASSDVEKYVCQRVFLPFANTHRAVSVRCDRHQGKLRAVWSTQAARSGRTQSTSHGFGTRAQTVCLRTRNHVYFYYRNTDAFPGVWRRFRVEVGSGRVSGPDVVSNGHGDGGAGCCACQTQPTDSMDGTDPQHPSERTGQEQNAVDWVNSNDEERGLNATAPQSTQSCGSDTVSANVQKVVDTKDGELATDSAESSYHRTADSSSAVATAGDGHSAPQNVSSPTAPSDSPRNQQPSMLQLPAELWKAVVDRSDQVTREVASDHGRPMLARALSQDRIFRKDAFATGFRQCMCQLQE